MTAPAYMTAQDVAEELQIGLSTAYRTMRRMPRVQIGSILRVSREEFRAWRAARACGLPDAVTSPTPSEVKAKGFLRSGVYFVFGAGLVKIGRSTCIGDRIQELRCGSPVELHLLLVLPGDAETERELHDRFAHLRRHGEWFDYEAELEGFVLAEARKQAT
jgi:hypothetical protein